MRILMTLSKALIVCATVAVLKKLRTPVVSETKLSSSDAATAAAAAAASVDLSLLPPVE